MNGMETNVFPITNLGELTRRYRLYHVLGLSPDQAEFHQNRQHLRRKLSFALKTPVTTINRNGETLLVVPDDSNPPPSPYPLIRTRVRFEECNETFPLNFMIRSPENDEICLRFLSFMIQTPLYRRKTLWQPSAGQPYFYKNPEAELGHVIQYLGFRVRPVVTPESGLGVCVDVTHRYVEKSPLPTKLCRDDFYRRKLKGRHCIYRFGHSWYEIRLDGLDDRTVTEYDFEIDGEWVNLLDFICQQTDKPLPPEVNALPHDGSVALYANNQNSQRAAPTGLCYLVSDTATEEVGSRHGKSILKPERRRELIHRFVERHMQSLRFGDQCIRVSPQPVAIRPTMISVPDLKFGSDKVLSVRQTPGTEHVTLDSLGEKRLELLRDKQVGFHCNDPLVTRQYFFLPQSVADTYGPCFITDLCQTVDELFPQESGYSPTLVRYNDRVKRTFPTQGRQILDAAERHCTEPGHAVVMIHRTGDRRQREQDQLAAMVLQKLRDQEIFASVIHTEVAEKSYRPTTRGESSVAYEVSNGRRGRLSGYLQNVALNKVLLNNERWPFVLATPLHADLTFGIDVKHNTAAITIVSQNGTVLRRRVWTSRQKERLTGGQLRSEFVEMIRDEAQERFMQPMGAIVGHRDGRLFPEELDELEESMRILRQEGTIGSNASLSLLEVPKTAPVPLRLFDVIRKNADKLLVRNPEVGSLYIVQDCEAWLCSTGRAFPRKGTVRPLHVRKVHGDLPFQQCLEDLCSLTVLALTNPRDCSRDPVTIRLTDRLLNEVATSYDTDAVKVEMTLAQEIVT